MFKKVCSARPQALWRAERMSVREHDKKPRTPLRPPASLGACFFNIPLVRKAGGMVTRVTARYNLVRKE